MAKADAIRNSARKPFGEPSQDEIFEILIPEGADTGKIPAGDDYIGQLLSITFGNSKSSGKPMYTFVFTIAAGDYAGMDFELYCPLQDNAIWKLSDTLSALGVEVTPGEPMKIRAAELKNTLVRLVIADDKTNTGREVSKLRGVLPHPDGAGTKAKSGKGFVVPKKAAEPEDEEEQDEDEDEQPRRKRSRTAAEDIDRDWNSKKKHRPRDEDENDEEDEDEDEVPQTARSRGRARDGDEDEEEDERPRRRPLAASGKKRRL